jgi:pyruvyl transferase EpsO
MRIYENHKNITICARDTNSYNFLKKHFCKNNILLTPDMAFFMYNNSDLLKTNHIASKESAVFIKRKDKELNTNYAYSDFINEKYFATSDWPAFEKQPLSLLILRRLISLNLRAPFLFSKATDIYASLFFKRNIIKSGVKFVNNYNKVYTTRLHAAILCCLLEKPFLMFDNSYGKNSSFFQTWLTGLEGAELILSN